MCLWEVEGAPCPVILYLDSLSSRKGDGYIKEMKAFLTKHWNGSHDAQVENLAIQGFCLSPPQQQNGDDCGLYVLKSMQLFCLANPTLSLPVDILETHTCECACMHTYSTTFTRPPPYA